MKAAVFYGPKDIRFEEVPKPQITADEFLLKVGAAAICGSDLRTYLHGHFKVKTPHILGHEFAGTVVEVGANVTGISVGDRVSVHPGIPCGTCYYCKKGQQNMCEDRPGIGTALPGALAEYVAIPKKTLAAGTVAPIPEEKDFELGALGDPLVSALNGQENVEVQFGDTVVILGAGAIGMYHAMLSKLKGAGQIILANRGQDRLDYAKERQIADHYFSLESGQANRDELDKLVKALTDGRGAEVVIVANTSTDSAAQAVELAAKNGKVLLFAGFPKDAPELGLDGNLIHYRQIKVMGSLGSTPLQYQKAIRMLVTGQIDGKAVVTHRIPLSQIVEEGFQRMMDGTGLKVVINEFDK
ncbi:alcohol dehydrogenase [Bacilli bacterium]|nr:alcohol dehydrogenase [Bacilli bacterium]